MYGLSMQSLSYIPTICSRVAVRTPQSQSGTTRSKNDFVNTRNTILSSLRWRFRQMAHAWRSVRAIRGTRARRARGRLSGPRSLFVSLEKGSRCVFYFGRPAAVRAQGVNTLLFVSLVAEGMG